MLQGNRDGIPEDPRKARNFDRPKPTPFFTSTIILRSILKLHATTCNVHGLLNTSISFSNRKLIHLFLNHCTMPRKKQKSGPAPRSNRPSGPAKPGPAPASQAKNKASKPDSAAGGAGKEASQKKQSLQANQRPIVPFLRGDRILLVGEGKYFSHSCFLRCGIFNLH